MAETKVLKTLVLSCSYHLTIKTNIQTEQTNYIITI